MNYISSGCDRYAIKKAGFLWMTLVITIGIIQRAPAQTLGLYQRAKMQRQLEALQKGGKLLYISFLPGQENTSLLIAAKNKYHLKTAVFWMSRGEGMYNYNGPEKGIDLGVIHVAEMEKAAKKAGFTPFVSSCKDLGARDTASINATFATDRLILDLAAVIRQYRPDILVTGHKKEDAVVSESTAYNVWMDSITTLAAQLAAGALKATSDNPSLPAFKVHYRLADESMNLWDKTTLNDTTNSIIPKEPLQTGNKPVEAGKAANSYVQMSLEGEDALSGSGRSYRTLAINSQLSYRSIYPDSILNNSQALLPYRDLIQKEGSEEPQTLRLRLQPGGLDVKKNMPAVEKQAEVLQSFLDGYFFAGSNKTGKKEPPLIGLWSRLREAVEQHALKNYNTDSLTQLREGIAKLNDLLQSGKQDSLMAPILSGCLENIQQLKNNQLPVRVLPDRKKPQADGLADINWVEDQLHAVEKHMAGLTIQATADQPYGILGQPFRLNLRAGVNRQSQAAAFVWALVPGLTDTIYFQGGLKAAFKENQQVLFDSTVHLPLLQEAYQPFWLNKSLRSDGSYQIDPIMQGRLSDTTSYQMRARAVFQGDTLDYQTPVMYRYFDRMAGKVTQPFYTKEPLLVTLTPTVILTAVLRNRQGTGPKFLRFNVQTLFNDTTQVALFKIRQVGTEAVINGQRISSDTASTIYHEAELITPKAAQRHKLSTLLTAQVIKRLNPRTPFLKPTVLLKLPEGVQGFSSNIKTVGYPYQNTRIYNYHSQTIVVKDTIHTTGSRLLYVNGLDGDVFENAFSQLGYQVQSAGFSELAGLADEVDLTSGFVPSIIKDSLEKLDCIVLSGQDELLPRDSMLLQKLRYILSIYAKAGGRILNLDPDPDLQQVLPESERLNKHMLIAGSGPAQQLKTGLDSLSPVLNAPNRVRPRFFTKWEGVLSRAAAYKNAASEALPPMSPFWFRQDIKRGISRAGAPVKNNALFSPLTIYQVPYDARATDGRTGSQKKSAGSQINCFLELMGPLSNGHADAYRLLANLLAYPVAGN